MELICATEAQLEQVKKIYAAARLYMKEHGNPSQWGDTYPDEAIIRADIAERQLYLCVEEGEILGVLVYFEGEEPTYRQMEMGQWLNDSPAGVVHRVAVARHGRGVASFCLNACYERCHNLKIDTHRDNLPMQRTLQRCGFALCGTIRLESGEERLAYQKCDAAGESNFAY